MNTAQAIKNVKSGAAKASGPYVIKTTLSCPPPLAQARPGIDSDFRPILIGTVLDQNTKHSKDLIECIYGSASGLAVAIVIHAILVFIKK